MSTVEQDLASFTRFADQRIRSGDQQVSIDDLFDQWRMENPTEELYAQNVAAVRASINDFVLGERGTAAGEHSQELRREFGIGDP